MKYWLTFNEINNMRRNADYVAGVIFDGSEDRRTRQNLNLSRRPTTCLWPARRPNKLCHEIIPDAKIGCMLSLSNIYPYNCDPQAVFETMDIRRKSLFYSDVMIRGYYPGYIERGVEGRRSGAGDRRGRSGGNPAVSQPVFWPSATTRTTAHEAGKPSFFRHRRGAETPPNPFLKTRRLGLADRSSGIPVYLK